MEKIETLAQPFEQEQDRKPVEPVNRIIKTTQKRMPIEKVVELHDAEEPIGLSENLQVPVTDDWILEQMERIEKAQAYNKRNYNFALTDEDVDYDVSIWVEAMKVPETENEAVDHYVAWMKKENEANTARTESIRSNAQTKSPETALAKAYERSWRSLVKGTEDYLEWLEERVAPELFETIEHNVRLIGATQWLMISDILTGKLNRTQTKALLELKTSIFGLINLDLMTKDEETDQYYRDPDEFWIDVGKATIQTPEMVEELERLYKGSAAEVVTKRAIAEAGYEVLETSAGQDVWQGMDIKIATENGEFPAEIKSVSGNLPLNEAIAEIHKVGPGKFMVRKLDGEEHIVDSRGLTEEFLVPKNMVSYASNRPIGPIGLSIRVPVDAIDPAKKESVIKAEFEAALGTAIRNFDRELERSKRS